MAHMTWLADSSLLCSCQGPHSSKPSPVVCPSPWPQALELPQSLPEQDHGHGPHWSWADLWADVLPHCFTTNLLKGNDPSCTQWVWSWPAGGLPPWPWVCLITTHTCLIVWTLGWVSAAVYGPALLLTGTGRTCPGDSRTLLWWHCPWLPIPWESSCPCCFLTVTQNFYLIKTVLQTRTRCQSLPCNSHKVISSVVGDFQGENH